MEFKKNPLPASLRKINLSPTLKNSLAFILFSTKTTFINVSLLRHAIISSTMRNCFSSILHNSDNRDYVCCSASYIFSLLAAGHLTSIAFPMKDGTQFFHHTNRECSM